MAAESVAANRFKSFDELWRYLIDSDELYKRYVYPYLLFGTFFQIPSDISGFGSDKPHPCVLVETYPTGLPTIAVHPRTSSQLEAEQLGRCWLMPGGIVPGLERDGMVLCYRSRRIGARDFRHCDRIGRLPELWLERLQREVDAWRQAEGNRVAKESEE